MNEDTDNIRDRLDLKIPTIKTETETQTLGHFVERKKENNMEEQSQNISIKKRRNLSKNRGQAMRQREKTPEPGRTPVSNEDTTSDDEDMKPKRTSREIVADNMYEEMKRLVQEQAAIKDPVYDIDTDEVLEARAMAANERRRRSVSPFAVPDKEEIYNFERKGSFTDPTNKLLSTTYTLSPKEGDTGRRKSLTIEPPRETKCSISTPTSSSPKDKNDFQFPLPTTPKRLDEMVYPDEKIAVENKSLNKPSTPAKKENVFSFEEKDVKPKLSKPTTPKSPEMPIHAQGEIVTKVIQVERTPSKKLSEENKPVVEIRQRVVRTPSRKSLAEAKPVVIKQSTKVVKEEVTSKTPPVKPARSQSITRFWGKTSESDVSEDQMNVQNTNTIVAPRRRVVPTPRRFLKRVPRENRSQSVNRVEDLRTTDKTSTGISQTSKEIIDLMEQARARSLSIPKDDPKIPIEYKTNYKTLMTPNKTPSTPKRYTRGISCPKTIQIISDKEILSNLSQNNKVTAENNSRHSSGYIEASQSEVTSSCYSSTPSDNEYNFDLSERTAELTRKLNMLSQEVQKREDRNNIILSRDDNRIETNEPKSVLRKRPAASGLRKTEIILNKENNTVLVLSVDKKKEKNPPRFKLLNNWGQFVQEHNVQYQKMKQQLFRCISHMLLLIIMCGLGGLMFKSLEGSFENAYKCGTRNVKRDFIESLWRGSHYLREEDWKSMARKKLYEFENQLHTAHEAGVTSYSGQRSWNFMNSFVYCLTLITTIGYGHIAPKTTYGRIATIVYAIIGIPLFLIVLADFGKLFTRIIKFFWAFIRRFYYTRSCKKVRGTAPVQEVMKGLNIVYDVVRRPSQIFNEEDMVAAHPDGHPLGTGRKPSDVPPPLPPKPGTVIEVNEPETPAPSVFEIDDEFNLPISLAIFILVVYIIIGAVVYNCWESWDFFESFYFVFISMSTIGLGDLVPDHPMFMMASILYLVFGLALTSMCINVVQLKLSDTFKKASAKIGATMGFQLAEEDGSLVPCSLPETEIVPVHNTLSRKNEESDNKVSEPDESQTQTKL